MSFASGADLSNIFRVVNFGTGVLCVLGGISQFFPIGFQSSIIAIYVILFGVGIAALEVQVPPFTYKYASFLFSFLGRGLFYIFVGTILLHDHWLRIVAGVLISVIGLAYVALEFVPSVELPENMKPENHSGDYDNATDTI